MNALINIEKIKGLMSFYKVAYGLEQIWAWEKCFQLPEQVSLLWKPQSLKTATFE